MALSRKFLAALGIEADKVDEIINAHSETVNGLKDDIAKYKEDAEKLPGVQKELEDLKKQVGDDSDKDPYKVKYEALKEDFDTYKKTVETEKSNNTKLAAYKNLLKEIGISEKRIDSVARLVELDKIQLDKDGKIEGLDEMKKNLTTEWADFIVKDGKEGAGTSTPPDSSTPATKTKEEIMKIKDTQERQKAWVEYIQNGGN